LLEAKADNGAIFFPPFSVTRSVFEVTGAKVRGR
jgi:hypothetical protein